MSKPNELRNKLAEYQRFQCPITGPGQQALAELLEEIVERLEDLEDQKECH